VRVAAEDDRLHLSGSVYTYVEVPDFSKALLSLSGIVLGTADAPEARPYGDLLPIVPSARREFSTGDRVTAFMRVYQGGSGHLEPVTVTMRIVDARTQTMAETRTTLFDEAAATGRSADYRVELPLDSLTAGPFLLTIEAATRGKLTVKRDVRFAMRP
jgi:hypothetical protein